MCRNYSHTHTHTHTHTHVHTDDIVVNVGTVEAGAEFSYGFKIVGEKLGKFTLVVGLDSNKTEMVTGEKEVSLHSMIQGS